MKTKTILLTAAAAFLMASCANDPGPDFNPGKTVEVVSLSDYLPVESKSESQESEQVLRFNSIQDLRQTAATLEAETDSAKSAWFAAIGFDGAYTLLDRAYNEMDAIFEMDDSDSIAVCNAVFGCMDKYRSLLEFAGEDDYDVTPSLPFEDDVMELLGSRSGYVVVGSSLLKAGDLAASRSIPSGPVYGGEFIEYRNTSVKNGRYTSYMRVGRNGMSLGFKAETYKTILFIRFHDKKCIHYCDLEFWNSPYNHVKRPIAVRDDIAWSLPGMPLSAYAPSVNFTIHKFCSTRDLTNKKTQTFTGVAIR